MVSKASDDLPLPLGPETTLSLPSGTSRLKPFRLFCRAPRISITPGSGTTVSLGLFIDKGRKCSPHLDPNATSTRKFVQKTCGARGRTFVPIIERRSADEFNRLPRYFVAASRLS